MPANLSGQTTVERYTTRGGISVERTVERIPVAGAIEPLIDALDSQPGVLLTSSYEYPGRYTRWDLGFVNPPLRLTGSGRRFEIAALNARGRVLLPAVAACVEALPAVAELTRGDDALRGRIEAATERFVEEERSKQPSLFTLLRALV